MNMNLQIKVIDVDYLCECIGKLVNKHILDSKQDSDIPGIDILTNQEDSEVRAILLIEPNNSGPNKYVVAFGKDNRRHIVALPLPTHELIVELYEDTTGQKLFEIRGGYIKTQGSTILIGMKSLKYGKADHSYVARLLNDRGILTRVHQPKT